MPQLDFARAKDRYNLARLLTLLNKAIAGFGASIEPTGNSYPHWLDDQEFMRIVEPVLDRSMLGLPRLYVLYQLMNVVHGTEGDVAEAGVYRGGSARVIADVLRRQSSTKSLHLFDSFAGLPEPDSRGDAGGDLFARRFATSQEDALLFIRESGYDRIACHPGWIPETLSAFDHDSCHWSFVHLDLDFFQSTLGALKFLVPRLSKDGVILLDDYGGTGTPGVARACREFLGGDLRSLLYLPGGQALLFRR